MTFLKQLLVGSALLVAVASAGSATAMPISQGATPAVEHSDMTMVRYHGHGRYHRGWHHRRGWGHRHHWRHRR